MLHSSTFLAGITESIYLFEKSVIGEKGTNYQPYYIARHMDYILLIFI